MMSNLFKSFFQRIAANPRIYNFIQKIVGVNYIQQRLKGCVKLIPYDATILDIGGGTGIHNLLFNHSQFYICGDIDPQKLYGYRSICPNGNALLVNGTILALGDQSVDCVLCTLVTHHLSIDQLQQMIEESHRILKPKGIFLLLDAVWNPQNTLGRLLWNYDPGSYPRSFYEIEYAIGNKFHEVTSERVSVIRQ